MRNNFLQMSDEEFMNLPQQAMAPAEVESEDALKARIKEHLMNVHVNTLLDAMEYADEIAVTEEPVDTLAQLKAAKKMMNQKQKEKLLDILGFEPEM